MPVKVIVHVNQHVIKANAKHGLSLPTLTVKIDGKTRYAYEVHGESASVIDSNARGRKPLSCGARVWIEYQREGFVFVGPTMDFETLSAKLWMKGLVGLPQPTVSAV